MWQPYGCEWTIGYLWLWTSLLERLDLTLLALMLAYIVVVVVRVSYRCHVARRPGTIGTANGAFPRARGKLTVELGIEVGSLKSIALTAPYLGLAGTCVGILSAFRAYSGSRAGFVVMVASGMAAALMATAAGLLVAVPATWSYNYLRTRLDSLENELHGKAVERRSQYSQAAQKFPLAKRFSALTGFALIAAPALAFSIAGFMTFSSLHTPKGLPVRLVKIGALEREHPSDEPIVIEIIGTSGDGPPAVYVNSKKALPDGLENRLRSELKVRPQWQAYVEAENNVSWRDVVNVIDVVEGLHANVVLLTSAPIINVARKSTR